MLANCEILEFVHDFQYFLWYAQNRQTTRGPDISDTVANGGLYSDGYQFQRLKKNSATNLTPILNQVN